MSGRAFELLAAVSRVCQCTVMTRPALTARQREALDFIAQFVDRRAYSPTIREVADSMGIGSLNAATDHIKALERKGYLTREPFKSRTMRPVRWACP